MIIGISGLKGSGKNTVANYIKKINPDLHEMAFANAGKDIISTLFGWPRYLLEGDTEESRIFRETVDPEWEKLLDIPGLTPRYVLQRLLSEGIREGFSKNFWVACLEHEWNLLRNPDCIITDVRFDNEVDFIRKNNGHLIIVKNPNIKNEDNHVSETSVQNIGQIGDFYINNNGTLDDLEKETKNVYLSIVGMERLRNKQ